MKKPLLSLTWAAMILLTLSSGARAGQIRVYRGELSGQAGQQLPDGLYDFAFSIYATAEKGSVLWQESDDTVLVSGGAYSVPLGARVPLDLPSGEYWLELTINGETLSPRSSIQLKESAGSPDCTIDGNLIVNDSVGIGTAQPSGTLDVVGDIVVGANDAVRLVEDPTGGSISVKSTTGGDAAALKSGSTVRGGLNDGFGLLQIFDVVGTLVAGMDGSDGSVFGRRVLAGVSGAVVLAEDSEGGQIEARNANGAAAATLGVAAGAGRLQIRNVDDVLVAGIDGDGGVYGASLAVAGSLDVNQTIYARGVSLFADGTASEPAIAFLDETNTGIFRPQPSTVGFTVTGSERMRIASSGNVGIGTDSPARKLTVLSDQYGIEHTDGTRRLSTYLSATGGWFGTVSNDPLKLFVNNGDTASLTIGTNGQALFDSGTPPEPGITFDGDENTGIYHPPGNSNAVAFTTASSERMRIDAAGNVGIGTTAPTAKLEVNGGMVVNGVMSAVAMSVGSGMITAYREDGQRVADMGNSTSGIFKGVVRVFDFEFSPGLPTAGLKASNGEVFGQIKSFIVTDPGDRARMIRYSSLEGPEAAMYIRGKAQLSGGSAVVQFPAHFSAMAVPSSITVSLTPRSADSRGLAAVLVSGEKMEVVELTHGTGSYDFDYTVYATRKGYEDYKVYMTKDEFSRNY